MNKIYTLILIMLVFYLILEKCVILQRIETFILKISTGSRRSTFPKLPTRMRETLWGISLYLISFWIALKEKKQSITG